MNMAACIRIKIKNYFRFYTCLVKLCYEKDFVY